jgi:hypothetical protein
MMRYGKFLWVAPWVGGMFILLVFLTTGCSLIDKNKERLNRYTSDRKTMEEGNQAFHGGDFERAMDIFARLIRQGEDGPFHSQALYGFACASLVLAENPDQRKEALAVWDTWDRILPVRREMSDPRMLTPFLQKLAYSPPVESPKEKEPPREKGPPKEPSPTEKQEDQGLLQSKEKEIERLRNKLSVKEEEVRTLKSQIESLETIHQTIQEKKKELSSP